MTGYCEIPELDGAIVVRLSDYHGAADVAPGSRLPEVGQVVLAAPNHICPVVDHVASFLVVRDGEIVDTWPVDARGRHG
jgi:D-serine deaminase-like pyridoxal phosphate-dependent protein